MADDLFGLGTSPPPSPETVHPEEDGGDRHLLIQIMPAPSWFAMFKNNTAIPLVCYALVEFPATATEALTREIRPMLATSDGQIEDAASFEGFRGLEWRP